ncbi:MAG TPA: endospore germination permease [Bacillota bacterium]|nr:endospore germination permease [Bacillota bacterium]
MNAEMKIGTKEAMGLLAMIMSGKIFLSYPRDMAALGGPAGWMIVVLAGVLSLIGLYFMVALLRKFPSQNIVEIGRKLGGAYIGSIPGLVIFLFFLILTSLTLRKYSETFILTLLPRTPISVISFFSIGIMLYAAVLGIETLTRVAWFFAPYLLTALVIILFFSFTKGDPGQLAPVFGPGPVALLKHSLANSSLFGELLLLPLIAPLIRKQDRLGKVGGLSLAISISIIAVVVLGNVLVFNDREASRMIFPIFQLARLINFGEFIQRVESVFVFLWFFAAGVQLCGLFYGIVTSFAQTFRISNYRPLVFPLSILVFTISLLPGSMSASMLFNDFILSGFYAAIAFGLPFLLWVFAVIFKKGETQ